jgi:hypothetical protein
VERDYMKIAAARVHVSEGATADAGTIVARPSRRIRGSVIDHMRRPVGGAKVSFVSVLRGERYPDSMRDTVGTYTHANGSFEFEAPAVDGFLLAEKTGFGTIPSALENASEIVLPPPAFVRVDATAAAKANDLLWTCSVRWPDLVPEAIWRVGYFLPHTVSVAPGRVEVIGNFEEDRRDLEPGAAGIKSRTIDILEGQTTSVTFDR